MMVALALAAGLALASPGVDGMPAATSSRTAPDLAPRLDPGPFGGGELMLASVGVLGGDVLVVGGAYLALTLFANGTIQPSASNFRTTAYVLGASALLVPPLTAALLAWAGARGPLAGGFWKAALLAAAGEAAALVTGYLAAPNFWLILPVQLATISVGASYGLHWGRSAAPAAAARAEPGDPGPPPPTASRPTPVCPDA